MTSSAPTAAAVTFRIDPAHSLIELTAKYMMFTTVKGRFTGVTGTILEASQDPDRTSFVEADIDTTTLTTGDPKRDEHLRSADFLDVEHFPTITFRSTRVEGTGEQYRVVGDLTIHGATREVTLDTTLNGAGKNPWGKEVVSYSARTTINRKDFGLNWNVALEAGGVLVSDRINIQLEIQAVRED